MADKNKDEKQEVSSLEKAVPLTEQAVHFEREKAPEKKDSPYEKVVSDELKREIEMMELDDEAKADAEKKAKKIEFLGEKEKIEHLLEIAKEKGLIFAIQVARKMNEPYLLDILHDTLAREGYYQKLGQTTSDDDQSQTTQSNNNSANSK